jgi:hypothetical protein
MRSLGFALTLSAIALTAGPASAALVPFSSGVATYNQPAWNASEMIDGITTGANGWAILRGDQSTNNPSHNETLSETALLTFSNALAPGYDVLTISIYQNYGGQHTLGDFSLGYATDATPTLASAETPFTISGATSQNGTSFTFPAADQILAGGPSPDTDVYTITAIADSALPITGLFLNVIDDPSNGFTTGGPGRQPVNGNFVVNELTVDVPEPSSILMFSTALAGLGLVLRSRQRTCG